MIIVDQRNDLPVLFDLLVGSIQLRAKSKQTNGSWTQTDMAEGCGEQFHGMQLARFTSTQNKRTCLHRSMLPTWLLNNCLMRAEPEREEEEDIMHNIYGIS